MKASLKTIVYSCWKEIFGAVSLMLVQPIMLYLIAQTTQSLVDSAITGELHRVAILTLRLLLAYGFLSWSYYYMAFHLLDRISYRVGYGLKELCLRSVLRGSVERRETMQMGDILTRFDADISQVAAAVRTALFSFISGPLNLITSFVYIWVKSPALALIASVPGPALFLTSRYSGRIIRQSSRAVQDNIGSLNSLIHSVVRGASLVKAFQLEGHFEERFQNEGISLLRQQFRASNTMNAFSAVNELIGILPRVLLLGVGGYFATSGSMSIGFLFASNQLIGYLSWPFTQMSGAYARIQSGIASFERVAEFLSADYEETAGAQTTDLGDVTIAFERVSFIYKTKPVGIYDISFVAQPKQITAIVGSSGSGKTTLVKLILGLYEPASGSIVLNGVPVSELGLSVLRSLVAYVPQELELFEGTIYENIRLGNLASSRDEVMDAARMAHVLEYTDQLPQGIDTPVLGVQSNLSGGQKQRIAIARAFLRDAPILVMDEPTSALDPVSSAFIEESIETLRKQKTVIIVTHDEGTVKRADNVIVMLNGRLDGTEQSGAGSVETVAVS